jgi:hypothetical protein
VKGVWGPQRRLPTTAIVDMSRNGKRAERGEYGLRRPVVRVGEPRHEAGEALNAAQGRGHGDGRVLADGEFVGGQIEGTFRPKI